MNTEELTQEQAGDRLQFDAHEFDGLREALEKEAEGIFGKLDQYVREHPLLCIGLAAAAGFVVVSAATRKTSRKEKRCT
jgi:ElaB/YqjD/DUF883 family membrane-anchored ribosome-binding protein